jgi:hypothetical protein
MAVGKGRKAFRCTLQVVRNNHLTEISAQHLKFSDVQLPVIACK